MKTIIKTLFLVAIPVLAAWNTFAEVELEAVAAGVTGEVHVTDSIMDRDWHDLRNTSGVIPGERIKTGADGAAVISFYGGASAMSPVTELRIADLSRDGDRMTAELEVNSGRVMVYARRRGGSTSFTIATPHGKVKFSSAEVAVTVDEQSASVQAVSGSVSVNSNGTDTELESGTHIEMMGKADRAPVKMDVDPAVLQDLRASFRGIRQIAGDALIMEWAEDESLLDQDEMFDLLDRGQL